MTPNFRPLSDAQLLDLIEAAITEAKTRASYADDDAGRLGRATLSAAKLAAKAKHDAAERQCVADARERAREAEEQAQREAERVVKERRAAEEKKRLDEEHAKERRVWEKRKGIAQAVIAVFGNEHAGRTLQVWEKDSGGERRVYINSAKRTEVVCYYVTGNRYNPPGTLGPYSGDREAAKQLLGAIGAEWRSLKVDIDAALAWDGDAAPITGYEAPAEAAA